MSGDVKDAPRKMLSQTLLARGHDTEVFNGT